VVLSLPIRILSYTRIFLTETTKRNKTTSVRFTHTAASSNTDNPRIVLERLFKEYKVGKDEILSRNCGIPIIEYGVSMKMNGIENVGLA
jgi:hypothetical protein